MSAGQRLFDFSLKNAKWVALVGVTYILLGGLLLPLKPGLVDLDQQSIISNKAYTITATTYGLPKDAVINRVVFQGYRDAARKNLFYWVSDKPAVYQDQKITFSAQLKLGEAKVKDQDLNVFVEYNNGKWMFLPAAIFMNRAANDTTGKTQLVSTILNANFEHKMFEMSFPNRVTLNESVRNLFYHVPMWFSMLALLAMGMLFGIKYLNSGDLKYEMRFDALIRVGILAGILGCITGATWARVTWGSWWPKEDPKLNGVAIGMLMYFAYLILRSTMSDPHQRARISAIYSVFIFPIFVALIAIMPKLAAHSLHPGSGDSVGFNQYDLDSTMRLFFWPAVMSWIALFWWIHNILFKIKSLEEINLDKEILDNN